MLFGGAHRLDVRQFGGVRALVQLTISRSKRASPALSFDQQDFFDPRP